MSTKTNLLRNIIVTILALIIIGTLWKSGLNQQTQIVEAKQPTASELFEQAKTAKEKALKQAEIEDNKAKAYELLDKVKTLESDLTSSESLKVQR